MNPERESTPYIVFMLVLSLIAIVTLVVSALGKPSESTVTILQYADIVVCALFFIDFLVTLARAPNRWRYFATWGWLDLLSSIPAIDPFRLGRAARILRILRLLRGIKAAKVLATFILYRRAQSAVLTALLLSLLLIVLAASAVLQFETSPDANIRTPEDAVWWAVVTITTVGYGDRFPLSQEGRLIAVFLMTAGVGLFGTFSGFVAAWLVHTPDRPSTEAEAIARLEGEIRQLRELIGSSRSEGPG